MYAYDDSGSVCYALATLLYCIVPEKKQSYDWASGFKITGHLAEGSKLTSLCFPAIIIPLLVVTWVEKTENSALETEATAGVTQEGIQMDTAISQ